MVMQINEFRLFLEVAELGSFTRVAVQRNTVQSNISRQINELESMGYFKPANIKEILKKLLKELK
jgi:hypothetical protein